MKKITLLTCLFCHFIIRAEMNSISIVEQTKIQGKVFTKEVLFCKDKIYIKDESIQYDILIDSKEKIYYFVDHQGRRYGVLSQDDYVNYFVSNNPLLNLNEADYSIQIHENKERYQDKDCSVVEVLIPKLAINTKILLTDPKISLKEYYRISKMMHIGSNYGELIKYQSDKNLYPCKSTVYQNGVLISETVLIKIEKNDKEIDQTFLRNYQKAPMF